MKSDWGYYNGCYNCATINSDAMALVSGWTDNKD